MKIVHLNKTKISRLLLCVNYNADFLYNLENQLVLVGTNISKYQTKI